MRKKVSTTDTPAVEVEQAPKKRTVRRTRKTAEAKEAPKTEVEAVTETPVVEAPQQPVTQVEDAPAVAPIAEKKVAPVKPIPALPEVHDFCELAALGGRFSMLSDQQIQQLTYEEAEQRCVALEGILRNVLDYDIVLSDTNIWLELLTGHTSSHSDPRVNARLAFERQLEFISRMMKRIGGKFMIMSETYEEVDRFATQIDPVNYKDVDWQDEAQCRNVAARLAKRLMLAQQKENRLRIEGIGSESHHAAFADPVIIRRTVELFAQGKKVLLLTNDASVGIRSLGMCDDLQRVNKVDDTTWRQQYEPQRPMVLTMDDLKMLDQYNRQYHFLCMAANRPWMQDAESRVAAQDVTPLQLWLEGFRPGDHHERRSDRMEQQRKEQQRKEQQRREQEQKEQERKAQEQREQERKEQERREQERKEQQRKADRERAAARKKAKEEEAAQAATVAPTAVAAADVQPADNESAAQPSAPVDAVPVEEVAAQEVPAEGEAKPERKRTHRGGRGRRKPAKAE